MADDETNALIAQLLSEDNAYAEYYDDDAPCSDDAEGSDADFGSNRKPKRMKNGGGTTRQAPRKRSGQRRELGEAPEGAEKAGAGTSSRGAAGGPEVTASGRRKRKDTGAAREKGRGWSEEEERLFNEGLVIHGRDWKACAAHVGTRDSRAIASHAQKHFVKLCINGQALPAKVAESGTGYTLSGKPLDPESAAAKAYGFKAGILERLRDTCGASLAGIKVGRGEQAADKENGDSANTGKAAAGRHTGGATCPEKLDSAQGKTIAGQGSATAAAPAGQGQTGEVGPCQPTEYARNRPRRAAAGQKNAMGHTTESLELLKCLDFVGPPGSGAPQAQPFHVDVLPEAMLLMDVHAHLSGSEVIGLLGGTWEPGSRRVRVVRAFPCRRALGTHSGTSVELDPAAEVETRALMEAHSLTPVGWYHSHPVFAPKPSQKDAENQRNYQALFRCEASSLEPFLGAIVGPYDVQMPSPASCMTWFVVRTWQGALTPYHVRVSHGSRTSGPEEAELDALHSLINMVRDDGTRINFTETWRPFTSIANGQFQGPPLCKFEKLQAALTMRVASQSLGEDAQCVVRAIVAYLQESWAVSHAALKDSVPGAHELMIMKERA